MGSGVTSPPKVEKRIAPDSGEISETSRKRMKMQDLDSALRSEEIESNYLESSVIVDETAVHGPPSTKVEGTQVGRCVNTGGNERDSLSMFEAAICLRLSQAAGTSENEKLPSTKMRLISDSSCDDAFGYAKEVCRSSLAQKVGKEELDLNVSHTSGFGLDLNSEDVPNALDQNPFYPYKTLGHVKSTDASECGSCTGPLEDNEPLKLWKTMKQNGFLSSSHGGIPIPKQRGPSKKSKNDTFKKKIELAKREQVNRFTKIAAPSGLLSGLNPGIINHVRNSKQVHSIIEALVRSEKPNCQTQKRFVNHSKKDDNELDINGTSKSAEYANFARSRQTGDGHPVHIPSCSDVRSGLHSSKGSAIRLPEPSFVPKFTSEWDEEKFTMKMASSENVSCLSSEEFLANQDSITSLSVKAATVASQWLDLLYQDIRGRLAALKRSKKRVRTMIQTELPSLMSQQFMTNPEKGSYYEKPSGSDMHMARWRSIFTQMEKALSEEGKHLENWLKQVKEMQEHCEQGLQFVDLPGAGYLPSISISADSRLNKAEAFERECAVRAAAASIYSTSNLVLTAENVPCF
ncbi:hypothetical protein H6P81_008109 [Aristolochia fimbriata]|uniref:Uncharacterized protein n=1 Tax=Aristolochia fimbriata TaxID=158543 RepID=A0AAV7F236_ARIFI|nr:hypothetical protein H6P81_008109 [Aristolochia fimbriata]